MSATETNIQPGRRKVAEAHGTGDLTPALIETSVWNESMLADAGIPVVDAPFVTVGGGLGSLATGGAGGVVLGGASSSAAASAAEQDGKRGPTVRVRQGEPIRIFTARDLDFSRVS